MTEPTKFIDYKDNFDKDIACFDDFFANMERDETASAAEAYFLLKEYAASFHRHIPFNIRLSLKKNETKI